MTIRKSTQISNDEAKPPIRGKYNRNGSPLRLLYAKYEMTGNESSGDVIQMVKVRKGDVVHQHNSYLHWNNIGINVDGDVGDGVNQTRYCDGLELETDSGDPVIRFDQAQGHGVKHELHEYNEADTIDIKFLAVTNPNSSGVITMWVMVTRNG